MLHESHPLSQLNWNCERRWRVVWMKSEEEEWWLEQFHWFWFFSHSRSSGCLIKKKQIIQQAYPASLVPPSSPCKLRLRSSSFFIHPLAHSFSRRKCKIQFLSIRSKTHPTLAVNHEPLLRRTMTTNSTFMYRGENFCAWQKYIIKFSCKNHPFSSKCTRIETAHTMIRILYAYTKQSQRA